MSEQTLFEEPRTTHVDEPTVTEQVVTSIKGQDEELEKKHPYAPLALVFGFYPFVLLVVALLASIYFFVGRDTTKKDAVETNTSIESISPDVEIRN